MHVALPQCMLGMLVLFWVMTRRQLLLFSGITLPIKRVSYSSIACIRKNLV